MASHAYGGDSPGLAGKHHWGAGSVGIPGALIAVGGYLDSSIDQTTEAADEFYGLITGVPSGLVLEEVGEDGGIVASSTVSNGYYNVPFDLYRWGAKIGSSTFATTFGTLPAGANLSALTMTAGGSVAGGAASYSAAQAGVTNLAGATMVGASLIDTGAVSFTAAVPGAVTLAGSTMSGGATASTGAVTFTPAVPGVVTLAGPGMSGGSAIGTGLATLPGAAVDLFVAPMSAGSLISTGAITNQVYARAPDGAGYIPRPTYGPARPANTQGSTR